MLEHFGDSTADARCATRCSTCRPTVVQCIPAIAERWRARGRHARVAPGMMASGGMLDSCYMWRRDGFLGQRIETELAALRKNAAKS